MIDHIRAFTASYVSLRIELFEVLTLKTGLLSIIISIILRADVHYSLKAHIEVSVHKDPSTQNFSEYIHHLFLYIFFSLEQENSFY